MGSEAPSEETVRAKYTFHITGFKKFHGVAENPTESIVSSMKKYDMPPGATIGSCTVLETAGAGALGFLMELLDSALPRTSSLSSMDPRVEPRRIVWVHLGVNSGATKFAIERRAFNEATFRCPDEMGWHPQRIAIVPEDGPPSHIRESSLPVEKIVEYLVKEGFEVTASDDAGRFVCNYDYYHSLRHAAVHSTQCIFVHVPSFSVIDEDTQMRFALALLHAVAAFPVGNFGRLEDEHSPVQVRYISTERPC